MISILISSLLSLQVLLLLLVLKQQLITANDEDGTMSNVRVATHSEPSTLVRDVHDNENNPSLKDSKEVQEYIASQASIYHRSSSNSNSNSISNSNSNNNAYSSYMLFPNKIPTVSPTPMPVSGFIAPSNYSYLAGQTIVTANISFDLSCSVEYYISMTLFFKENNNQNKLNLGYFDTYSAENNTFAFVDGSACIASDEMNVYTKKISSTLQLLCGNSTTVTTTTTATTTTTTTLYHHNSTNHSASNSTNTNTTTSNSTTTNDTMLLVYPSNITTTRIGRTITSNICSFEVIIRDIRYCPPPPTPSPTSTPTTTSTTHPTAQPTTRVLVRKPILPAFAVVLLSLLVVVIPVSCLCCIICLRRYCCVNSSDVTIYAAIPITNRNFHEIVSGGANGIRNGFNGTTSMTNPYVLALPVYSVDGTLISGIDLDGSEIEANNNSNNDNSNRNNEDNGNSNSNRTSNRNDGNSSSAAIEMISVRSRVPTAAAIAVDTTADTETDAPTNHLYAEIC